MENLLLDQETKDRAGIIKLVHIFAFNFLQVSKCTTKGYCNVGIFLLSKYNGCLDNSEFLCSKPV